MPFLLTPIAGIHSLQAVRVGLEKELCNYESTTSSRRSVDRIFGGSVSLERAGSGIGYTT
jgi:hypothetical protein